MVGWCSMGTFNDPCLISWNRNRTETVPSFSRPVACRLLLGPRGFVADGWFAPKRKVQDPESVPGARDEDGRGESIYDMNHYDLMIFNGNPIYQ